MTSKLTWEQVGQIRARLDAGESKTELARAYNISVRYLYDIRTHRAWIETWACDMPNCRIPSIRSDSAYSGQWENWRFADGERTTLCPVHAKEVAKTTKSYVAYQEREAEQRRAYGGAWGMRHY